jgi:hypothetical protein
VDNVTPIAHAKKSDIVRTSPAIIPENIEEAYRLAQYVSKSGLAPQGMKTPEQCMVAIMHGLEIGLPPMQAVQKIAVINGRPSIWGDAVPALLLSKGFRISEEPTESGHKCTITRPDGQVIVRQFTKADAEKAGLWNKSGPWKQYPQRMLQMRARSLAARDGAADVLAGMYLAEEAQDIPVDTVPGDSAVDITPTELPDWLQHDCFEQNDSRPNPNHYKTKLDGQETYNEVTGQIHDCDSFEKLKQMPDLYADEIRGMPLRWAQHILDALDNRRRDFTDELP